MKVGTFLFIASCLVGRWLPFALAYGMTTSRVVGHCYRAVFDCTVNKFTNSSPKANKLTNCCPKADSRNN